MTQSTTTPTAPVIVPVILAGGNGTRLWPLSRRLFPKQFLSLGGQDSLLQRTARRVQALPGAVAPVVVAAEAHRFLVREHLDDIGLDQATILLEPASRNTAPAIAAASQWVVQHYGGDAIVLALPADHVLDDVDAFAATVMAALPEATRGSLLTFGITPSRAETGYGYIRAGTALDTADVVSVAAFVEKPDAETAERYVASGDYKWNSGMFAFTAAAMVDAVHALAGDMGEMVERAVQHGTVDDRFLRLQPEAFTACEDISVDYAIFERSDAVAMASLPATVGWDDVGSWTTLERLPADDAGNKTLGTVRAVDAGNNLVHAGGRLVALVGVDDLVVVETDDAVLVTTRERAQDVKALVSQLADEGRDEVAHHPRVYRPWGFYETISLGERFQCKRILVKPEAKLSLQMHHHRSEHWVVVRGTAVVTIDGQDAMLSENESTYIPLGTTHRLYNPGKVSLELIEVQSGAYLGEDDIVRFDDAYGRDAPQAQAA